MAKPRRKAKEETTKPQRFDGPTNERLRHSEGHYAVGDDQQGTRVYQFMDTPLARLYSRLVRAAGTRETQILQQEYTALMKYRHHWHCAGLEASLPSMDLGRTFASDPTSFSGMAKSERQFDNRVKTREAKEVLGHRAGIVVDNVVCAERTVEEGGHSIGYDSPYRARLAAVAIIRDSGHRLAQLWGIN